MIVVADTGPLPFLILLDHAELLHRFYGEVVIPYAVAIELSSPSAPNAVRDWMSRAPPWLRVVPVEDNRVQEVTDELDLGERAAIALAGAQRRFRGETRSPGSRSSSRPRVSGTSRRRCHRRAERVKRYPPRRYPPRRLSWANSWRASMSLVENLDVRWIQ